MADFDQKKFYDDLVHHKLILPSSVSGVFGRGAVFEDVLARFNDLVTRISKDDGADVRLYPPVIPRQTFEQSDFLDSFPHLAGSIFSFEGNDAQAKELSNRIHAKQAWDDTQKMTDLCMAPAACYNVYPSFTGMVPEKGCLVDVSTWVFRREPSLEATRMQSFRMREFVRVSTPEVCATWRDTWLQRGLELLISLGLPAKSDIANDPFFGRVGRMLAVNQKDQKLKFEVLVPVISEEKPTAVCSFNYHQDHFGLIFGIKTPGGEVAHTACLGFGMERITMALFKTHGFEPSKWPKAVREKLWV